MSKDFFGEPLMGRFLLTLIVAVGIGVAIAWHFDLGPFAKESVYIDQSGDGAKPVPKRELGKVLYEPLKVPVAKVIDDQVGRPRRYFDLADSSVYPIDKQDVAAAKDGPLI